MFCRQDLFCSFPEPHEPQMVMASTHPQASIILSPTDFGAGAYSDGGYIVV